MLETVEAVIFDLDGTLVDSMWLWKSIDLEYLARFNIELPMNLQKDIEGMSFTETAGYFKERFSIIDDIETIKADWNEMAKDYYLNRVTLKEKAFLFLEYLKSRNIKTGIATSNSKELVSMIIKRFDLEEYFDSIRTSCEVDRGKPHPDIYLKVANDLGVSPDKILVFEDVPMGIMAGKNAGMKVCAIYDEFSKAHQEEIRRMADYYILGFNDIICLIEEKYNVIFAN